MKVKFLLAVLVSVFTFGVYSFDAQANEVSEEIADNYQEGEYLSPEDEAVIQNLMETEEVIEKTVAQEGIATRAVPGPSGTYNFSGNNAGVYLNGFCNYNFWGAPINLKFNCTVSSTNKSIKSSNSVSVRHIGYGVGKAGIFKAYDQTFSNSNRYSYVSVLPNVSYGGLVAYGTFTATASSDGKSVTRSGRTN